MKQMGFGAIAVTKPYNFTGFVATFGGRRPGVGPFKSTLISLGRGGGGGGTTLYITPAATPVARQLGFLGEHHAAARLHS
jgi:hypothetical protein